ncbi:hypothetical protein IF1G_05171 [Cordyceps javanica]|uniref:Uncharacterized protein n=1 Tax=Cordyceps javanica TaxID=43265 RepID=A0A545V4E1_9HYPO|nr:hypothetical protein IF1G_05171 [Cordyceps javanica]
MHARQVERWRPDHRRPCTEASRSRDRGYANAGMVRLSHCKPVRSWLPNRTESCTSRACSAVWMSRRRLDCMSRVCMRSLASSRMHCLSKGCYRRNNKEKVISRTREASLILAKFVRMPETTQTPTSTQIGFATTHRLFELLLRAELVGVAALALAAVGGTGGETSLTCGRSSSRS